MSAKGIVLRRYADGGFRVLLARNPRGEWELPGGRPEAGESERTAVAREVTEETGQLVWVDQLVDRFDLVIPDIIDTSGAPAVVEIAAYACHLAARRPLRLSAEHGQLAWLPVVALPDSVPAGYVAVIVSHATAVS
ncbi:NUDIX domain-containing protein [Nakamurella lactea]|uniref:NUDIX domain-containing protein n=1 Tax=Nakamurella lactea TaxID=459515 RepID=UPI00041EDA84|nr:NUDIX hydrolase [Nakamurella lactea]